MSFTIKKIPFNDLVATPWKNGKGVTRQIAIEPTGHNLTDPFHWRLSTAEITTDGEFSQYPQYERLLSVISGAGLDLRVHGNTSKKLLPGEVYQFSGNDPITGKLVDGPVKDLGLIFHPQKINAEFHWLEIRSKPRSFEIDARVNFIYLISGEIQTSLYPGEEESFLSPGDTLRIDLKDASSNSDPISVLLATQGHARVLFVEIR